MSPQVEAFRLAAALLDGLSVTWWLSDGSVLGAVREGGFLAGDPDVDLGIWAADMPMVRDAFNAEGWPLKRDRGGQLWPTRDGVKVDIHGHQRGRGRVWFVIGKRADMRYEFDADLFGDLDVLDFHGVTCRVPSPAEQYLIAHYGPAWRTPAKGWRWDRDPPCLRRGAV